ncbi:hypothetical protein BH09BAC1_BH09BAC1_23780 [soil metagenome]
MHILFVCSANKDRSKTAEIFLSMDYPQHTFSSAGTNQKVCMQLGTEFITHEMLDEADLILVMEQKHFKFIKEKLGVAYATKMKVLSINDVYAFGDAELKRTLVEKTEKYLII